MFSDSQHSMVVKCGGPLYFRKGWIEVGGRRRANRKTKLGSDIM
jgi:hypothetical protein